jgi:AraC family transcriptional regulator of adaptative response/methylated-DNA-[protein]-cysteine methyltransferase
MKTRSPNLPTLRGWLLEAEYEPVLELASSKKHILSLLTALTYDIDVSVSERAIAATGLAAKIIAERDPEYVRNYLLRLFWLVNDESGGICWRAPELIGEILYNCPTFDQFFPMLTSLLDLEKEDAPLFRRGTLWAIGRVAQAAREAMLPALPQIQVCIVGDEELATKEMALWCMRQLQGIA